MTRLKFALSLGVIFVLIFSIILFDKRKTNKLELEIPELKKGFTSNKSIERINLIYQEESKRIGSVDPNPEETKNRLEFLAKELNEEELEWLKQRAIDKKIDGDERFFATYLLALHPTDLAVQKLKEIAISKLEKIKESSPLQVRKVELERAIRAQSIEGLGHHKSQLAADALLEVEVGQEDQFLQDRAHRALYEQQTGKKVQDQDKEALKKVLYGKQNH